MPGTRALQQVVLDALADTVTHRLPLKVTNAIIAGAREVNNGSRLTQKYGDKLPNGAKDLSIGLTDEHEAA